MKLAVCAALGILVLLLTTSSSSAYEVCAEWVNEYNGYLDNLNNNDENAQGFYNELSSDSYWSGALFTAMIWRGRAIGRIQVKEDMMTYL